MENAKYLPQEIINIILQYDGRITYRHGVYIDKIDKDDIRYTKLKRKSLFKLEYNLLPNFYYASIPLNYKFNIAIDYDEELKTYVFWFVKHIKGSMSSYQDRYIL